MKTFRNWLVRESSLYSSWTAIPLMPVVGLIWIAGICLTGWTALALIDLVFK